MKIKTHWFYGFLTIMLIFISSYTLNAQNTILSVTTNSSNELIIAVNPIIHEDYGFSYPITYILEHASWVTNLSAWKKYSYTETWNQIPQKTSADFFSGVEAVRFSEIENRAYISVPFSPDKDSIYIRLTQSGNNILFTYQGIAKYYDNRIAVVTASADDWHQWFDDAFNLAIPNFRNYNIPLTVAIVTDETTRYNPDPWMTSSSWASVQNQLDSGEVEAASHSRNHLHVEYPDVEYEVRGSCNDILTNLNLNSGYRKNNKQYVYTWIAPYGDHSTLTDSMVQACKYLVSRLYYTGQKTVSNWIPEKLMFEPIGLTIEIGAPSWGGGETNPIKLQQAFDEVYSLGGVYHLMCHPQELRNDWNAPYLTGHLNYIGNRKDIWYTTLGHLYLYQMIYQGANTIIGIEPNTKHEISSSFYLEQNYPNPFNPNTSIQYALGSTQFITLKVYDVLGREVATLVNEEQSEGKYEIKFEGNELASGIYFYKLEAGNFTSTKKLVLMK